MLFESCGNHLFRTQQLVTQCGRCHIEVWLSDEIFSVSCDNRIRTEAAPCCSLSLIFNVLVTHRFAAFPRVLFSFSSSLSFLSSDCFLKTACGLAHVESSELPIHSSHTAGRRASVLPGVHSNSLTTGYTRCTVTQEKMRG